MPSLYEAEDFETEMIILPQIKDLHRSLLEEEINEQLKNPFDSKVNFIETFNQQLEEIKDDEDLSEDDRKKIDQEAISFYTGVIKRIDEQFFLQCAIDNIAEKGVEEIQDICEAMYSFFVLKRKKNIKNIMLNYILENSESICNALDYLKKKTDVTSANSKNFVNDDNLSIIVSNLQTVLQYIKSLDNDMLDMIEYLDLENFNNAIVAEMMEDCTIVSSFQQLYFAPLFSYHDCNYDDILAKIEHGIYSTKKKKG